MQFETIVFVRAKIVFTTKSVYKVNATQHFMLRVFYYKNLIFITIKKFHIFC